MMFNGAKYSGFCFYCNRKTHEGKSVRPNDRLIDGLRSSKDHVTPRSKGGKGKDWVNCCAACNNLKGDMLYSEWRAFMAKTPEWWTLYETRGNRGQNLFYNGVGIKETTP